MTEQETPKYGLLSSKYSKETYKKTNVHIYDSEMMTHVLLNLPEEYQTIVEILEDKLNDKDDPLTIESISDNILVKFDQMKEKSGPIPLREDENPSA